MHHEAALLGSNGVVAWLDRDLTASVQDITAAIVAEIGMLADDVCVVKHFPEALLVRFFHQHHGSGRQAGTFRSDTDSSYADGGSRLIQQVDLVHHVRSCLDGLPAWRGMSSRRSSHRQGAPSTT
ncbi:hypothetical protein ZWY2020_001753 [Hordeum vulgare]|nr:hypothetical protein ZWY2020_001753 [Hordeum vulgare]